MNILLVEDNDIDVMIFQRALKNAGTNTQVVRARDGLEALEILTYQNDADTLPDPYVILLDINMPRMNGHEFLEALRENQDIADARVVVVTTSNDPRDVRKAYGRHASGYFVKPNETAKLSEFIKTLHHYWANCEHPEPRDILGQRRSGLGQAS